MVDGAEAAPLEATTAVAAAAALARSRWGCLIHVPSDEIAGLGQGMPSFWIIPHSGRSPLDVFDFDEIFWFLRAKLGVKGWTSLGRLGLRRTFCRDPGAKRLFREAIVGCSYVVELVER